VRREVGLAVISRRTPFVHGRPSFDQAGGEMRAHLLRLGELVIAATANEGTLGDRHSLEFRENRQLA
jgi:hypothetical protein